MNNIENELNLESLKVGNILILLYHLFNLLFYLLN